MATDIQPGADTALTLESHVQGRGLLFEVSGVKYILRSPTPAERDGALREEQIEKRWLRMNDPRVKELADLEAPREEEELLRLVIKFEENIMRSAEKALDDDIEDVERRVHSMYSGVANRTAADAILLSHGRRVRSRYLAKVLLCDANMEPLSFEQCDIEVQDVATDRAEYLWENIHDIPFLSEQLQD